MQIKNLSMSFGVTDIFDDITLNLPDNEVIGVVGSNGAGKTTLFKILMGKEVPTSGKIIFNKKGRVGWLPQVINYDIDETEICVLDYLMSGRPIKELTDRQEVLYSKLSNSNINQNEIYSEINKIQGYLDYYDHYNAEITLIKIIEGMGIDSSILDMKLCELSGGQKSKISFARLLYSNPEIILLDEPTNHLDQQSKEYVIDFLKHYYGTVFIISHDIDLLDNVCSKILFLDKRTKKMLLYDGNYSRFRVLNEEREQSLIRQASIQQQEEEKLKSIINKYATSSGKKKKMAQDREKKLEKLLEKKIEVPVNSSGIDIKFNIINGGGQVPLLLENVYFRYDKTLSDYLIHNLSFELHRGEKFLILGENGVGKSTLLKLIVGILKPDRGKISIGVNTKIGYYAQELEMLDKNIDILSNFLEYSMGQRELRNFLAKFLFYGNDVYKKVGVLSPGEQSRIALAKLALSRCNFLVLDEPTNHLDVETQRLISDVFKNYQGTMLVVSHNPDFVNNLGIERTLILPNGQLSYFEKEQVETYKVLNKKRG